MGGGVALSRLRLKNNNLHIQDPDSGNRTDLSEAPDKPPNPFPGQYSSSDVKTENKQEFHIQNTGKYLIQ